MTKKTINHGLNVLYVTLKCSACLSTHLCTYLIHGEEVSEMCLCGFKSAKSKNHLMEQVLKSCLCVVWLYCAVVQLSNDHFSEPNTRDKSACVYIHCVLQNRSSEIDVNTFEKCWMCLPVDFHCTRG